MIYRLGFNHQFLLVDLDVASQSLATKLKLFCDQFY